MCAEIESKMIGLVVDAELFHLWLKLKHGRKSTTFCELIKAGISHEAPKDELLLYVTDVDERLAILESNVRALQKFATRGGMTSHE